MSEFAMFLTLMRRAINRTDDRVAQHFRSFYEDRARATAARIIAGDYAQ